MSCFFGKHLLPERASATLPADLSGHARTLIEQYGLADGVSSLRVRATSPLVGAARQGLNLSGTRGSLLVALQDGASGAPLSRASIGKGDFVVVRGKADAVASLAATLHLTLRDDSLSEELASALFGKTSGLAEVVIPPRSGLIGRTVFPGMVTDSGDLIVVAAQRAGVDLGPAEAILRAGDTILLQGSWKALDLHLADPDVLVVNSPDLVRRQAVPMGPGAGIAVAVLAGLVLLLATGIVQPAIAGLLPPVR